MADAMVLSSQAIAAAVIQYGSYRFDLANPGQLTIATQGPGAQQILNVGPTHGVQPWHVIVTVQINEPA